MIIWGGGYLDTGSRYDPLTDTWIGATSTLGVPAGRRKHSAAWTGTVMVVFGGETVWAPGSNLLGGLYDPQTDTWVGMLTETGAPPLRVHHTAIWTGSEVIFWGGWGGPRLNTGVRYAPPQMMAPGTYGATISVSDPNASNNPQSVSVTLDVTP